ncbi:hypothetical protein, partial [Roseibium sp. RKSG952]|uniref:hypothetical protein n=1 Tax=Roseibium sp. RKSG952 TaxID=2529384 RepID=UPI001AD94AC9
VLQGGEDVKPRYARSALALSPKDGVCRVSGPSFPVDSCASMRFDLNYALETPSFGERARR